MIGPEVVEWYVKVNRRGGAVDVLINRSDGGWDFSMTASDAVARGRELLDLLSKTGGMEDGKHLLLADERGKTLSVNITALQVAIQVEETGGGNYDHPRPREWGRAFAEQLIAEGLK